MEFKRYAKQKDGKVVIISEREVSKTELKKEIENVKRTVEGFEKQAESFRKQIKSLQEALKTAEKQAKDFQEYEDFLKSQL